MQPEDFIHAYELALASQNWESSRAVGICGGLYHIFQESGIAPMNGE